MSPARAQTIVSKFHRLVKGTMAPWKDWFSDCDRKSTRSAWDILLYQKARSKKSNGIVVFLGYSVSWSGCWLYGNVQFIKIHCDSLMPGPLSWTSTQETTWKASPWPRRFYLSIWKKKTNSQNITNIFKIHEFAMILQKKGNSSPEKDKETSLITFWRN